MSYSYFNESYRVLYSAQQAIIDITVHSMPLNRLEHCICPTTMTNIRPDRDSDLVPPGYKPESIRMSHQSEPARKANNTAPQSLKAVSALFTKSFGFARQTTGLILQ